jgi:hypothetical protein
MKRYFALTLTSLVVLLSIVACNKSAQVVNYNNNGANTLLPLTPGNVWIYQDSVFDSTNLVSNVYTDSAYIGTTTVTSSAEPGVLFYNFVDSFGWFGPSGYLATTTDPYGNGYILQIDSLGGSPYVFFETATADATILGSSQDFSNPSCISTYTQYGFASSYNVNGYTCYRNIGTNVNCNSVTTETIVEYVCPGVGIVRIEDYAQDTSAAGSPLFLDYSQTLTQYIPK